MVGGLRDVITCAKFQIEIFMGYDFTGGRIFDFPIDFSMGLTSYKLQQCSATALPVINVKNFRGSLITVVRAQNDTSKTANITYTIKVVLVNTLH